MNRENQEKPYVGLLGLDKLSPVVKALNFVVTVIIGAVVVWFSTIRPTTSPTIRYEYWTLSLPLVFTYGLPVVLASLWLRLTGLEWRAVLLATILILILPFLVVFILTFFYMMMFPT